MTSSVLVTMNGKPPEYCKGPVVLFGFSVTGVMDMVQCIERGRLTASVHTEGIDAPCLRVSRPYATYPAILIKGDTLLRTREEARRHNEDPDDWLFELISGLVQHSDNSFMQGDDVLPTRPHQNTGTLRYE